MNRRFFTVYTSRISPTCFHIARGSPQELFQADRKGDMGIAKVAHLNVSVATPRTKNGPGASRSGLIRVPRPQLTLPVWSPDPNLNRGPTY